MPPQAQSRDDDWDAPARSSSGDKLFEWGDEDEARSPESNSGLKQPVGATPGSGKLQPEGGPAARFFTRFSGLPIHEIAEHPSAYLNPFSHEYWQKADEERAAQAATPPPTGTQLIPGRQTYEDIKGGNYAGAAGDITSGAMAIAPLLGGGRIGEAPPVRPINVRGPGEIAPLMVRPRAFTARPAEPLPSRPGLMLRGETAPSSALEPDQVIPPIRIARPWNVKLPGELPPLMVRPRAYSPVNADPIPTRPGLMLRGNVAGQNELLNPVGEMRPAGSGEGIPRTLSGESALRQILTGQGNAELLKIAKSRGINVAKEAQLKAGVADNLLVNKIIDDYSPEELKDVRDRYLEGTRFRHGFGDIGAEAQRTLSLQEHFPDLKIPVTRVRRLQSAVTKTRPIMQRTETPGPGGIPYDSEDLTPALQESLRRARAKTPRPIRVPER